MACSGGHCTRNAYRSCGGHRAPGTSTSGEASIVSPGEKVTATQINNLRNLILTETAKWNAHEIYNNTSSPGGVASGNKAMATEYNALDDKVHYYYTRSQGISSPYCAIHVAPPYKITSGTDDDITTPLINIEQLAGFEITAADYNSLVAQYNAMRVDCICHNDCQCNNICSCHNNCGCNYSDKRLKTNIIYL